MVRNNRSHYRELATRRQCEIVHNETGEPVVIDDRVCTIFKGHDYDLSMEHGFISISGPATDVDFGHADPLELRFCVNEFEVRIVFD